MAKYGLPITLTVGVGVAIAAPALAHDFWLQPKGFQFPAPAAAPFSVLVGHGPARERWSGDPARVKFLIAVGPDGRQDHRADLGNSSGGNGVLRFARPGTYVLAMQTTPAASDLPALRYNSFAAEEGLTPALALRQRTGQTNANGRETYSRRVKALIQVGPTDAPQPQVTRPVGLTLEIVPEKDPYRLKADEPLPVRILFEGRPLAGALVKLTNLDFDTRPLETHRSDRAGRAIFTVPDHGAWLINVIWTKPIRGNPTADFETTFSSLTFGYGPKRR
ncbi:DUF4198 domain-containing protein [Sphingomonas naphthae]|uniref:DUF4198 domain-containing protein n=1 Tax=Sphingomonas naphthae TaxID=1813468 RepID=A0ABY7TMI8_9SPHN|nr:DUF4198 domain-containing protein [Sphingomonas naphthae]WCT74448.1 DUF4198 domain-containing protein [Sphingomonas naphthae]